MYDSRARLISTNLLEILCIAEPREFRFRVSSEREKQKQTESSFVFFVFVVVVVVVVLRFNQHRAAYTYPGLQITRK